MDKTDIAIVLVIVVIALAAFQTVQLVSAGTPTGEVTVSKSVSNPSSPSAASESPSVPTSLQNLPRQVGGC